MPVSDVLEKIYESLLNDNAELDTHIAEAKKVMAAEGLKELPVDATRLAQNNRQGRKLMQAYFRQRGIKVVFAE